METEPRVVVAVLLRALFAVYRNCHDHPTRQSMAILTIIGQAIHRLGVTEEDWREVLGEQD